jgi:Primase C terminal 2 (PriCT-2)
LGDSGRPLWDDWSRRSAKYHERDQEQTWRSLRREGIAIGTLFHLAKQAGWQNGVFGVSGISGISAAGSQAHEEGSDSNWDNPDWSILDDRRGQLPEFPLDVLNETLREAVRRTASGAGVTVIMSSFH